MMNRITHTFYYLKDDGKKCHSEEKKVAAATLLKRGVVEAYYADIDSYAPSKGYFNRQDIIRNGKEV